MRQSPLYYQELRGFDVLGAALVLIPQGVGSFLTRTVTVPLALAGPGTSEWWLGAVLLVRGLGLGVVLIPVMTVAFVDIDPDDMPDASILTRISQQLGGSCWPRSSSPAPAGQAA